MSTLCILFFHFSLENLALQGNLDQFHFFDPVDGILNYGRLLHLLLAETAKAFLHMDFMGKLNKNIRIAIHNKDFVRCSGCKRLDSMCEFCVTVPKENCRDCWSKKNGKYVPFSHCVNCIPVVTHTKQGICLLVKRKGTTLIMDLIPVLPSPPIKNVMALYSMITNKLRLEMPPGWKKGFKSYFTKDQVIPEDMYDLCRCIPDNKDKGTKINILIKLLTYGPEPNYQIRAAQAVNAISKLTGNKTDRTLYQFIKVLKNLLSVQDVGSYTIKKIILSPAENYENYFIKLLGMFPFCLLYTSPSPRDRQKSRMPSSA